MQLILKRYCPEVADFSNPRSILVTGASSGIGAALALHYAAPGITLFISGRDEARLADSANSCRAKGADVHTWIGDVCDVVGVRAWIEQSNRVCPLNLVVANAGVALGATRVEELHDAAVKSFKINVNGVFNTVHPALEVMAARRPHPVENAQIAVIIARGLARNKARITFPWQVRILGRLAINLPQFLVDRLNKPWGVPRMEDQR